MERNITESEKKHELYGLLFKPYTAFVQGKF